MPPKSPIPAEAAQAEATKLVKEVYGDEWAAAKSSTEKQALAKKLLGKADETTDDPVSRFVLLRLARDIATQAIDGRTAYQAIDAMAESFQVDALEMKTVVLTKGASTAQKPAHHKVIAGEALKLADQAVSEDNFTAADKLGKLALAEARRAGDKDLVSEVQGRIAKSIDRAKAYENVKEARAALEKTPQDPEANLVVGKYLCFMKGDWDEGLPMLALGKDEILKALAKQEIEGAASSTEQVKLGDGWWSLAEKQEGTVKKQTQGRAGYWYQKALPGLSGLIKAKVEKRLRIPEAVPLTTPTTPTTKNNGLLLKFMDCAKSNREFVIGKTFDVRKSWVLSFEAKIPHLDPGWHQLFFWGDSRPGRDVIYVRLSGAVLEAAITDCRIDVRQQLFFRLNNDMLGKWVHIEFHYDASIPGIRLYVDETLVADERCKVSPILDRPMPISIGDVDAKTGEKQRFSGQIQLLSLGNVQ